MRLGDLLKAPKRAALGIKLVLGALALIIILLCVVIWLLVAQPQV